MENYAPNSHASRERKNDATAEKKKIEKVVSGSVKTKKKSELKKFADMFIAEDVGNVKTYVVRDVIIPTVKDTLLEVFRMFLFGGDSTRGKTTTGSKVSYGGFYNQRSNTTRSASTETRSRDRFDFEDIIIERRGEAEAVLDKLYDYLKTYDLVTVLDYYDAVGLTAPPTANKYGWTDLGGSRILPARGGGYIIKLPKVSPID